MHARHILTVSAAALSGSAGLASAQLDWTFVPTTGSPDPIIAFDLSDPVGSQTQIGTTAGNFNRGFDWADFNTAYYHISSDTLNNPGDRGVYRWDAMTNTSTQVFQFGFQDAGTGGGDFFNGSYYLTIDNGSGSDSLYRYDNLGGTVTETLIGDTGLSNLQGIAIDPNSGSIYGVDNSTDSLYVLDSMNGSSTLVGALGVTVSAIGGLDFSTDGSELLLVTAFGNLYEIGASDASIVVSYGDLGPNISALSNRPPVPAPGAIAALGLAGLAGTRRRR